ncbi:MAG TPA: glycosyl hydrolase-related protein, partial [Acidobacteriaceae bacterium]|nr:glycosyl hydrolase-related protein [Acidobacteriaceae bacterium]
IHPGKRKQADSFLSVDAPDVVVEAVKQSEDGEAVIVRSYETDGRETRATLDLKFAGTRWTGSYHPYEIKTLRIDRRTRSVREVNALEQ